MPRIARIVVPDVPHHVTHRGNNRQPVFFVHDDRRAYLDTLREQCDHFRVALLGYCLMTNHVHLVLTPATAHGLARAVGTTHVRHASYINRLHGRSGHLWAGRFFSCPLDEVHFWRTLVYVERNPVRAKLTRRAWTYPWSSAAVHVGDRPNDGLLDVADWRQATRRLDWRAELTRPEDAALGRALQLCTWTGRPLGSDRFVAKLETLIGRRLRALPRGRPKKARAATKERK